MATARQKVLAIAAEHKADLGDEEEGLINLWLPKGLMWVATDCHSLSIHFHSDRPWAWKELLKEAEKGVEECDADDCDTCGEED